MKKLLLVLILNAFMALTSWGQMNPIRDLTWWHIATTGPMNNCFSITWDKPVLSLTDTLMGYNIYQDSILYMFTTDTTQSCMGDCLDTISPFCTFLNNNGGWFYMHVTAVYNHTHLESVYNDSVQAGGDYTGIKEITKKEMDISSVIQNNSSITVGLNQPLDDDALLIVSNSLGQENDMIPLQKGQQQITINSPAAGLYFLSLKTNKEAIVRKIVVK